LQTLQQRYDTCSLKGSSIIQAVNSLDDSYKVIAFLDADALPHPTWLRELVAPLRDQQIGACTGYRWYSPTRSTVGSIVRYIWNSGAVVQEFWNQLVWGGSMAIQARVARNPQMLARWKSSITTDNVVSTTLDEMKLRTAFVSSLTMINRESCTIGQSYRFIQRQLLVTRLYHSRWISVIIHGAAISLAAIAACSVLFLSLVVAEWQATAWMGTGILVYALINGLQVLVIERGVRRIVLSREEPLRWLSAIGLMKFFLALPLTQFVYTAALAKATFMKTVEWRGVTYEIDDSRRVRMVEFRPYQSTTRTSDPIASI
jgi:cellulose synthase/poly-beta-1,6-N-acetylglucosamine synthase-like glycosyltransferase